MVDARRQSSSLLAEEPTPLPRRILMSVTGGKSARQLAEDAKTYLVTAGVRAKTSGTDTWERRGEIALERYEGLKGLMTVSTAIKSLPYVLLFLIAFLPAMVLSVGSTGAFNSPDETIRRLAADTFADTGQLYINDDITQVDPEFATGPRGYAQHEGRSIPTYSQLPMLFFGIITFMFGGAAPIVLAIIPGALFVTLALLARRIIPSMPVYAPWVFLGVSPLWYWSSRVYLDVAIAFLFVAVSLLFLVRAVQARSEKHLFIGGAFLGIAALSRIPEAPFLFMFGFAFVLAIGHLKTADRYGHLRLTAIYGASLFAAFFVPFLLLNWWTNGSPTTVSYTLLFEQNFPDRVEPADNIFLEPFRLVWLALFPQPVNFSTLQSTFIYQAMLLSPFMAFLGLIGVLQYGGAVAKRFGGYGAAMLVVSFVYLFLSRNDPGTFLAGLEQPDLRVTLVRYWMPLFVLLGVGATLAVARIPHRFALPLVAAFVVTSAYSIWYTGPESISSLERNVSVNAERYEQLYAEFTEADALVVAGSSFDKWTVPYRRTIGIWQDTATDENLRHLADTGAAAVRRGQPVYYMFGPQEPENAPEIVSDQLKPQFLGLTLVTSPSFAGDLWKVTSNPQALNVYESGEPGEGPTGIPGNQGAPGEPPGETEFGPLEYATNFESPGKTFTMTVDNDGRSRNLIQNPSFELSDNLWRGPTEQGPVEVSRAMSAYGESSLRMELSPAPKIGERVRRTYTMPIEEIMSDVWNMRSMIFVEELDGAVVEMLVYVQDKDSANLAKPIARWTDETSSFEEISIVGQTIPEGTVKLAIQISIVATEDGGTGVVFWDGIEVIDGPAIPIQYCDGDNFGCDWDGEPHQSASSRDGGIYGVTVVSGDSKIEIDQPLSSGDKLVFESGTVEIIGVDGESNTFGVYEPIEPGAEVEIKLVADATPAVSVLGP